ncbi:dITP/XTP pyrophosphatase [Candidatus Profftia lariciata]|uniref:RdgB/HAM1 family non-canonical purine NTP pyrophosphatase n=1 Tax=Candidatus Profftia lariciata TaxID=1987921 RepID=UPI001D00C948|nr:RdgB/HAM1 family non-canonical purine NTP pyrophosphatase [Candidatus Profftia lariciata]UDG81514.1 dITP/XTP pyrophosphatase [Candidatus Profftia lariciata]
MQKIVLATTNEGKIREIVSLLANFKLEIVSQTALGVHSIKEIGMTFIENAIIKARHAAYITGLPAIADDSGLSVDILGGAPGIISARYSGCKQVNDRKNIEKLLEVLKNVPKNKRQATFHCVLVYLNYFDNPAPLICHGSWIGEISFQPLGIDGFGYDSIFYIPELGCSAAQLNQEKKNMISHRGQALRILLESMRNV